MKFLKQIKLENNTSKVRLFDEQLIVFDGKYSGLSRDWITPRMFCGTHFGFGYETRVDLMELYVQLKNEFLVRKEQIIKSVKQRYTCDSKLEFNYGFDQGSTKKYALKTISMETLQMDLKKVFIGSEVNFYTSSNNVFSYYLSQNKTYIESHSINDELESKTKFIADGTIPNQFMIDEKNTELRVGTHNVKSQDNTLAIFNLETGDKISQLTGLGKNERLHAMTSDEERIYFLTATITYDPLYVIDVSDVENLNIVAEVKQPGFNRYLAKMNDSLIGFGSVNGIPKFDLYSTFSLTGKFSLADQLGFSQNHSGVMTIEDGKPFLPTQSNSEYSYKSIYIDSEHSLVAFPVPEDFWIVGTRVDL